MKTLFTALLLFFFFSAQAQTWIQEGATWHYDWQITSCVGSNKLVYAKDTTINGLQVQKIEVHRYNHCYKRTDTLSPHFLYQNGDTIFYLFQGKFEVLYNFSALPGDTWSLGVDTSFGHGYDTSYVKVDSVGTIDINNITYRWISVSCSPGSLWRLEGKIVERFGAIENYFFPIERPCDTLWSYPGGPPTYYFNCFEDDSFALYNPTSRSCEHLKESGINHNAQNILVKIFPNPATDKLHIKLTEPKGNYNVQIFDATGKKFTNRSIRSGEEVLDISALPKGIFIVLVTDEKGNFYSQRVLKL